MREHDERLRSLRPWWLWLLSRGMGFLSVATSVTIRKAVACHDPPVAAGGVACSQPIHAIACAFGHKRRTMLETWETDYVP